MAYERVRHDFAQECADECSVAASDAWGRPIRAPVPPFTPPSSLRFVGSIGELRQIGQKFKNCLACMDHYAMKLWFGLADGSVVFLAHDEPPLLIALRQVGRNVWNIEEVDGPMGLSPTIGGKAVEAALREAGVNLVTMDGLPVEIRIEAILVDLSEEATRRFGGHLRRWDDQAGTFMDEREDGLDQADAPGTVWALPLLFVGRYDRGEDDFVGNTFFDHPTKEVDALDEETEIALGQGRVPFTRVHKRLCGYVFLRTLRTGSRALSLQRGSLLDSILKLSGAGAVEMWQDTLGRLQGLDPAIGEIEQLKHIRAEVRSPGPVRQPRAGRQLHGVLRLGPDTRASA